MAVSSCDVSMSAGGPSAMQAGPAAEALVRLKDSARKRLTDPVQSPSKRTRDGYRTPKKQAMNYVQEGDGDEPAVMDQECGISRDMPTSSAENKRYNLRVIPPGLEAASSLSPLRQTSGPAGKTRQRKNPTPKVLVVGNKLKSLLKFQKAHQWCYYEWFYSDIDKPLFEGENEFCLYLEELFPNLKTRRLRRTEWHQLRRLMGKPRRCSSAFFAEECELLHQRREKIRLIQKGLVSDFSQCRDLPDDIPQSLVVGTRVTAWLHHSGVMSCYSGRVEAVQYGSNEYLVSFDRPGLGKHQIPDTEVRSMDALQTFSISELEGEQQKQWEVRKSSAGFSKPILSPQPALPSPFKSLLDSSADEGLLLDSLHRSPLDLAPLYTERAEYTKLVAQVLCLLSSKQFQLTKLRQLNTQAERSGSRKQAIGLDLQRQFAQVIVELDDINKQLNRRLEDIKRHSFELHQQSSLPEGLPSDPRQGFDNAANAIIQGQSWRKGVDVQSQKALGLIAKMSSILLQIEALANDSKQLDLSSLAASVQELGLSVSTQNYNVFQASVETPLRYIQAGLNPADSLHSFTVSDLSGPTMTAVNLNPH